jgi:hypothetical protein
MRREKSHSSIFFGMLLTATGIPLYYYSKRKRGQTRTEFIYSRLLTGMVLFTSLATGKFPRRSAPTSPVNCYGKDSCIQAVAYADMISIRVDATQNNVLTPLIGGVFF